MVTFVTFVRKVASSNPTLLTSTFCEKEFFAKSCSEQGGVRTRDLTHDRDEPNHQTKRLTSANMCAHARVSIKLRELFFHEPLFNKKCLGLNVGHFFCGGTLCFFPTKNEQLEQLHFCLCKKRPRKKKKQFFSGEIFVDLRSRIFSLEGGWRLSRTHTPNQTWLLPKNAVRRWGYAKKHVQHSMHTLPCMRCF